MAKLSAGILLYRKTSGSIEVLLIHPGGPFWRNRNEGAWMIPKGGVEPEEDVAACAIREFEEELGAKPVGDPWPLCKVRQAGGKWVEAFALQGDFDTSRVVSTRFDLEWPPRSGNWQSYPEVDRACWFTLAEAEEQILPSQKPILAALEAALA